MSQYLVRYKGFARAVAYCHVVVGRDQKSGEVAVLVGELDDNPGTSTINAIENVAGVISEKVLNGQTNFALYQYALVGIPGDHPTPTFYEVTWNGSGPFSMLTWEKVEPASDRWVLFFREAVKTSDYTMDSRCPDSTGTWSW